MYRELEVPGVGTLWWSGPTAARVTEGTPAPAAERVIPADGSADLILRDDALLIAGPSTRAIPVRDGLGGITVGLRFAPGFAGAALAQPAGAFRDAQLEGAAVLDPAAHRAARDLLRRARDAGPVAERMDRPGRRDAQRALVLRVERSYAPGLAGEAAWLAAVRAAATRGARAPLLAAELGASERQLRRRMVDHFGYGYTSLRRVVRAEHALRLLRAGGEPVAVAGAAGYADQAHLTRELRALAGTTPGALARQAAGSAA